jgi:integrating conjugative element protein (TIGR03758 family)
MSSAQISAFEAAAGDTVIGHANLWFGAVFVFLFLWAAWSLVVVYRGWANGNVSTGALGGAFIRLLLIILIGASFMFFYH